VFEKNVSDLFFSRVPDEKTAAKIQPAEALRYE